MTDKLPPIYFYIPQKQWPPEHILESPDAYWKWQQSLRYGQGRYNWTLQTYLHLKDKEFPCQLVGTMPTEGIVLAHRDFLPDNLQPTPKLLIVCLQADRDSHPYAQLHVIQNTQDEMTSQLGSVWQSYYMPHWRQAMLIPRDSRRGDKFENVAFFGVIGTLAPELQTDVWIQHLHALGLIWNVVEFQRWHDYSDVDVVVAVRSFNGNRYTNKPASKLYNAWYTGVPAILGCESAYQHERKSELDYIEVRTMDEAIAALKRLRDNPQMRQAMIENGRIRARETDSASLTTRWCHFLTDVATPAYYHWCQASSLQQKVFLMSRYLILKLKNVKNRWRQLSSRFKFHQASD